MTNQPDLFGEPLPDLPPGLRYRPGLIGMDETERLTQAIAQLPFEAFEFHGFTGKRRVVSFGWKYDFSSERVHRIEPMPAYLTPLRDKAAAFGGLLPDALEQALVTEYQPGATIGWHKDKAVFDEVIGVSLGAPCIMRFRRKAGAKWDRRKLTLEPGSAYIITGQARTHWEHSIPPVEELRYSVTFRSMRG